MTPAPDSLAAALYRSYCGAFEAEGSLTRVSPDMQRAPLEARKTADMPMSQVAWAWPRGRLALTASAAPGASLAIPASTSACYFGP